MPAPRGLIMKRRWLGNLGYVGFIGLLGLLTGNPHLYGFYGFFGFFAFRAALPPQTRVERLEERLRGRL